MRHKSWPFWETWKLIFGKDRAQGTTTEDIPDAAERARPQGTYGSECNENDYHPSLDDIPVEQTTPIAEQPGELRCRTALYSPFEEWLPQTEERQHR